MDKLFSLRQSVLAQIDLSKDLSNEEILELIDNVVLSDIDNRFLPIRKKIRLSKEIYDSIRGLDILQDILEDDSITEIMVNGTEKIFIERDGKIQRIEGKFSSQERLQDIIQQIVGKANRRVNETSPIVDTRLEDGSRVNIVLNPIAIDGPIITIRKFPKFRMKIDHLIKLESLTVGVGEFLKILVVSGYNIFVSGGTGSGKTTFLNVLSNFIPNEERVITIEDSAELQLNGIDNLVRLEVRQANTEGENEISIRDLIKTSLRMRPDRIVIGEVRGSEALDMLQAMNTGHDGSLSTGHANSPKDMLSRLETMVLMGIDIPLAAIKSQIAAGLDIIVHLGRLRDKSRRVLEIVEVVDYKDGEYVLNTLFKFKEYEVKDNSKVNGELVKTKNSLINTSKLSAAGYNLDI